MQPTFDEAARRLRRDSHEARMAAAAERKRASRARIEAEAHSSERRNGEFAISDGARDDGDDGGDSLAGAESIPDVVRSGSSLPLPRHGWTPNPIMDATRRPSDRQSPNSSAPATELDHCMLEMGHNGELVAP